VVGYLAELGVGAVYVSPLLRSTTGSSHGYDVVDHGLVDPDRGGDAGLAALAQECHAAGLGLVVDIVPNHMGVAVPSENRAWWDVLRCGQTSRFARWFDIDWQIAAGKILIPVLGDDADLATDLTITDGELRYYEHSVSDRARNRRGQPGRGARPTALPADQLPPRGYGAELPPVLRGDRPGQSAGRGPRGV